MMATQAQSANPFASLWRVVSMEHWDADFINGGQVHIEFGGNGRGLIQFGCVYGKINCWATMRQGEPAMEWCWESQNEIIARQSLGWAVLKGGELHGVIMLFGGDTSFVAERGTLSPPPRKPK